MVSIIIPTYNAKRYLPLLMKKLRQQTICYELIILDSESTDGTQDLIQSKYPEINLIHIKKIFFNHGSTRNVGLAIAKYDRVVFMTQDALPAFPETIEKLVEMLNSRDDIALAYGRQLPYPDTGIFGQLARTINYPTQSIIKTQAMIPLMGIKTCSCSNSFAAYRKDTLLSLGGFPSNTILGEDVSVAARFILQGQAVAYCAEAEVFHSHDYSIYEEFKRYFDIGVFHYEQRSVLTKFLKAESEGFKYMVQEWLYLYKHRYWTSIPSQLIRTFAKYIGYKLGRNEAFLPISLKRHISMYPGFWINNIKSE